MWQLALVPFSQSPSRSSSCTIEFNTPRGRTAGPLLSLYSAVFQSIKNKTDKKGIIRIQYCNWNRLLSGFKRAISRYNSAITGQDVTECKGFIFPNSVHSQCLTRMKRDAVLQGFFHLTVKPSLWLLMVTNVSWHTSKCWIINLAVRAKIHLYN